MIDLLLAADGALLGTVVAQAGIFGYIFTAAITAGVLLGCAYIFPGVHIENFVSALILALIVGFIIGVAGMLIPAGNTWLGAVISLVVGAGALTLADNLMESVKLDGFKWALAVAAVLAVVNGFLPVLGTL